MIFGKPMPQKNPPNAKRIMISTRNEDGSVGDLVICTPEVFSYGVSPEYAYGDEIKKDIIGYTLPLCLWDKNGATPGEKRFTDMLDEVFEHCKHHLIAHREEIERFELELSDMKKFFPSLYWKKERGKIVPNKGPTLYLKMIASKKDGYQILSKFYDKDSGDEVDPMQLIGKYCMSTCALKVESIFIGAKCSIQIKLYNAEIALLEKNITRLLRPSAAAAKSIQQTAAKVTATHSGSDESEDVSQEDDDDAVSFEGSVDESDGEEEVSPALVKKAPAKRKPRGVAVSK